MKRRNFLKGLLACTATALVPSIAMPKSLEIGFVDGGVRLVKSSIMADDILKAKAMLDKNQCKPMSDGNYVARCHPDVYDDLLALGPIEGIRASSNHNYLNMRGRW